MRKASEAVLGDTLYLTNHPVEPLLSIEPAKPMVFAGVYPFNASEHRDLKLALEKLCLNDSSVQVTQETSPALGAGWRLGFLGVLHMEVFCQRLDQEQDAQVVITAPSVPYKMKLNDRYPKAELRGTEITVSNPAEFLDKSFVAAYYEPMVTATILSPAVYMSNILELCHEMRGEQRSIQNIDQTRINVQFLLPLNEIVTNFFDSLKSVTSGYASFDYEDAGYEPSDLVRVDVLLNGEKMPLPHSCSCFIRRQECSRTRHHQSLIEGRAESQVCGLQPG